MNADEIIGKESQERMLMIIKPEKLSSAKKIFKKWGLSFSTIGEISNDNNICITFKKRTVANVPLKFLTNAKTFRRPFIIEKNIYIKKDYPKKNIAEVVKKILTPTCATVNIWSQYDHMISRNVISKMGENAIIKQTIIVKQ